MVAQDGGQRDTTRGSRYSSRVVITRLGDAARFESVETEIKEIEGTRVPVATPAALYRLKKDTVRAVDRQDAAALRERFDLKDEG
jgi:hypothetical protein